MCKKISIIIPTYNHLEDCLKPCIESIIKHTILNDDIEIIIVANGCIDGTKDYIDNINKKYNNFILKWIDEPLGYTKSINEGVKVSKGEYLVLLNNDIVLLDQHKNDWLNILLKPFLFDSDMGITGPLLLKCPVTNKDFIVFFCAMLKKSLFDEIGGLNEIYSPGSGEDIEFSIISQNNGFKIQQVPIDVVSENNKEKINIGNYPIYHIGEKTMDDFNNWQDIFDENKIKLYNRFFHDVAVIMPCYNSENTIGVSINSVLNQTYRNIILYVIDDNSTDDTVNIIKNIAYKDPRVVLLRNKYYKGPSGGRNTALDVINHKDTKYIAYCDSDDVWYPTHLELSLHNIISNEIDISYSDVVCMDFVTLERLYSYGFTIPEEFDSELIKNSNYIYISSVVHKTNCLNVGSFDSRVDSLEDWDYWRRMSSLNYKFKRIHEFTIIYNVKKNGMAGKSNQIIIDIIKNK